MVKYGKDNNRELYKLFKEADITLVIQTYWVRKTVIRMSDSEMTERLVKYNVGGKEM